MSDVGVQLVCKKCGQKWIENFNISDDAYKKNSIACPFELEEKVIERLKQSLKHQRKILCPFCENVLKLKTNSKIKKKKQREKKDENNKTSKR